MLQNDLSKILFIDIETVPLTADFASLPEALQEFWTDKHAFVGNDYEDPAASFEARGGIYAEYGKVICVSVGFLHKAGKKRTFRIKSFSGHDEKLILQDLAALICERFNTPKHLVCGHNIKEFDVPYLCRRMLVNGIAIPELIFHQGKKPWETPYLDTMQLWRFGDFKNYSSLKLLAALFGIESPKDDIDGKDVARVYWKEKDLTRIVNYCRKDVLTVAQLLLKFNGQDLLSEEEVIIVDE